MLIIYSDEFLEHKTGVFHPEKPDRLTSITRALQKSPWQSQLDWQAPTDIQNRHHLVEDIQRCHTPSYISRVEQIAMNGGGAIDGDTILSARSYEVALLAVSAWLDGVDYVLENGKPAFVLARPPGHHARAHTGMGFCVFSNAAIAAFYALDKPNINRVAILDWDVHHGNGTQEIVWDTPKIAYVSTHQAPFYPGTGWQEEKGEYGNILNLPMPAGSAIAEYLPVFEQRVMPFLEKFNPDLLIVSAGFDANYDDPLASMCLKPQDYGVFTDLCLSLTSKIVFGLEGGYDFQSLSESVVAVVGRILSDRQAH